ncbi:hypothetical protein EI555_019990 [Monodon monoceros]|uniref:Uncharacterized protein n=1 Tax=Monodon monoceros TaxID=40151 RepID=A0A4U1FMX4_MONMO|nr:hypothetical protein EI555_019990 [Monodon monoceros]
MKMDPPTPLNRCLQCPLCTGCGAEEVWMLPRGAWSQPLRLGHTGAPFVPGVGDLYKVKSRSSLLLPHPKGLSACDEAGEGLGSKYVTHRFSAGTASIPDILQTGWLRPDHTCPGRKQACGFVLLCIPSLGPRDIQTSDPEEQTEQG